MFSGGTMPYGGYSYLEPGYKPEEDDFVILLWAKGKFNIEKIAEAIAAESSVGTWTKLSTVKHAMFEKLKARVFEIKKVSDYSGYIKIAYPFRHFDWKNPLQFQASVLGNIFGLKELEELYVIDISFPLKWQKIFNGPKFGIEGIRKLVGTERSRRPHIGTIVKPKVGLSPKEFAHVAYQAYAGGLDLVKDDENLVDQNFCKWRERFDEMMKVVDKVERESGRKVLYSTNITDKVSRMVERVDYLKEHGWKLAMLDVYILGLSALMEIKQELDRAGIAIHAHRAGYAAHERGNFGVSFYVYEKFYRMIGVDQLHVGTAVGKMEGGILHVKRMRDIIVERRGEPQEFLGSLAFEWARNIKPVMPIASGGLDPTRIPALIELFGRDVTIQAGGGVHGHPEGTYYGAMAMKQAVDAVMSKKSLVEYAKNHSELRNALKTWGEYKSPVREVLRYDKKALDEISMKGMEYMKKVWEI
ncbi:MAG: ribulose-bisphosphate carboxylase large subunit [Candidatus Anstonellales archaeon]